jgi:tripartite-type tricarboxylate transporter receptor subunit TctC
MSRERNTSLAAAVLIAWFGVFSTALPAAAQSYPTKPIRLLLGFQGGAADAFLRVLGEGISPALGQPVVIETRAGAGGALALNALAESTPDGYTIGMGNFGGLAVGPNLRKTPWDPVKSFSYVTLISDIPLALVAHPGIKAASVGELVSLAKAQPGKLNHGSDGVGSGTHLAFELFKLRAGGLDVVHIPQKGQPETMAGFKQGDLHTAFVSVGVAQALKQMDDRIRILAVSAPQRVAEFPEVPSMQQAGLPGVEVASWLCILGPAGMPADIVQRLNREMRAVLARPEVIAKLTNVGLPPKSSTSEEMTSRVAREVALWREVIDKAKIKVN